MQFLDLIRGGTGNQGPAVAGDLPSDGAKPADVRGILSWLSDSSREVMGTVNSFIPAGKPNEQKPAVTPRPELQKWIPVIVLAVAGAAVWWFLKKKA